MPPVASPRNVGADLCHSVRWTCRGSDKLKSELARHQKKVQQYKHAVGILKEEKAELVLKVNELETRMSSMQVGSGTHSRRGSHPGPSPSPLKPRAVLEILNDMQAIKRKQHAYLEK